MSDSTGTNPVVDDIPLESVEQGNTLDGDIETNESTESRFFSKKRNAIILSALAGVGVFAASYLSWFADDSATDKNIIAGRLGYEHPERVIVAPGHSICWLPDTGMQPVEVSGFNKTHFFSGSDTFKLETDMVCSRGPRIDDTNRRLDETTATTCQDTLIAEGDTACLYSGKTISMTGISVYVGLYLQPRYDDWLHDHRVDHYYNGLHSLARGQTASMMGKVRDGRRKSRAKCKMTMNDRELETPGAFSPATGEYAYCSQEMECPAALVSVIQICNMEVALCDNGICDPNLVDSYLLENSFSFP